MLEEEELKQWKRISSVVWGDRNARQRWINEYILFPQYFDIINLIPHSNVLDYGCGDGLLCKYLNTNITDCRTYAYDEVVEMRELAKKSFGGPHVLDTLEGAEFDVICINMVIQDTADPFKMLEKIKQHLKHTGSLLIALPHPTFSLIESNHITTRREQVSFCPKHNLFRYKYEPVEKVYWTSSSKDWTYLYNRTVGTYSHLFFKAGFSILQIREPFPIESGRCESDLYEIHNDLPGTILFWLTKTSYSGIELW